MEIANLYTFSALILFLVTSLENHCPTPAIKVIANNRNVTVTKLSCNLRYDQIHNYKRYACSHTVVLHSGVNPYGAVWIVGADLNGPLI